jgi:hypothetical protein
VRGVLERVVVEQRDLGVLAPLERADAPVGAEDRRGITGDARKRVRRGQARTAATAASSHTIRVFGTQVSYSLCSANAKMIPAVRSVAAVSMLMFSVPLARVIVECRIIATPPRRLLDRAGQQVSLRPVGKEGQYGSAKGSGLLRLEKA